MNDRYDRGRDNRGHDDDRARDRAQERDRDRARDREHYRSRYGSGRPSGDEARRTPDDLAEAYLGKPRDMGWGEYLGMGSGSRNRSRDDDRYGRSDSARAEGRNGSRRGQEDDYYRSPNPNRLFRNKEEGKIAGVCAGLADYFNVDVAILRIAAVIGFFMAPPVVVPGYLILCVVLKPKPHHLFQTKEDEMFWRSVTTKPDQTLASLRAKFRWMDREISTMEGYVASKEFTLNREFRDLEKK